MRQEIEQHRNNPESWVSTHDFMNYVIPHANTAATKDLCINLDQIERRGLWSEGLAQRIDSVYTSIRGNGMIDDEWYTPNHKRPEVAKAVRAIERFIGCVTENIDNPNFDIDIFQQVYTKSYTELGINAAKWLAYNYSSIIDSSTDPWVAYQENWKVVSWVGRELGNFFTTGYSRVAKYDISMGEFAESVLRIHRNFNKDAVKTLILQSGKALENGFTLKEFEQLITNNCKRFNSSTNYWLIQAALQIQPAEADYNVETLSSDVAALALRYGEKTGLWFIKGACEIINAENWLQKRVKVTAKPEYLTYTTTEEWEELNHQAIELAETINYYTYRLNFGFLINKYGTYAAHFYTFVRANRLLPEYPEILNSMIKFIDNVGEKFAKKSLWFISRICGGSPNEITNTFNQITKIIETEGEEYALKILKYSYGPVRKKGTPLGLLSPKNMKD